MKTRSKVSGPALESVSLPACRATAVLEEKQQVVVMATAVLEEKQQAVVMALSWP